MLHIEDIGGPLTAPRFLTLVSQEIRKEAQNTRRTRNLSITTTAATPYTRKKKRSTEHLAHAQSVYYYYSGDLHKIVCVVLIIRHKKYTPFHGSYRGRVPTGAYHHQQG